MNYKALGLGLFVGGGLFMVLGTIPLMLGLFTEDMNTQLLGTAMVCIAALSMSVGTPMLMFGTNKGYSEVKIDELR